MLRVAVLDDGVYADGNILSQRIERFRICDSRITLSEKNEKNDGDEPYSHGTLCTYVMSRICPDFEVVDVKVIKKNGRGSGDDLVKALKWCYEQNIHVIHMSLGSIFYHDGEKAYKIVDKLIQKGVFLVAAVSNGGLRSFPATYPGVFGVRNDYGKELINGEYRIDACEGYPLENCFVAHMDDLLTASGGTVCIRGANSFAAPVITGKIVEYLANHPGSGYREVWQHLYSHCCNKEVICEKIRTSIDFPHTRSQVPVIEIEAGNNKLLEELQKIFLEESYHVECFSDFVGKEVVPLSYYCGEIGTVTKAHLLTWEKYYNPDVLLLCRNGMRRSELKEWDDIDIWVGCAEKGYILRSDAFSETFFTIWQLFTAIEEYFKEDETCL